MISLSEGIQKYVEFMREKHLQDVKKQKETSKNQSHGQDYG